MKETIIRVDNKILAEIYEAVRSTAEKHDFGPVMTVGYLMALVRIIEAENGVEGISVTEKECFETRSSSEVQ